MGLTGASTRCSNILVLLLSSSLLCSTLAIYTRSEKALRQKLMQDYDSGTRPRIDSKQSLNLTVDLVINNLQRMDQRSGDVQINVFLRHRWTVLRGGERANGQRR